MTTSRRSSAARSARCGPGCTTPSGPCAKYWKGTHDMSNNDLGDALLRFEARETPYGPDVREQINRVLTRDARRVKVLTFLTITAWLAGAALILLVMILFALLMPFQAQIAV